MKRIFDIALLKIKLTFRDRMALGWMFAAPIIFMTIFSIGFSGAGASNNEVKYPIVIVNNDGMYYSNKLIDMLKGDKNFDISFKDYEGAVSRVEDGGIPIGIVIPSGFSAAVGIGNNKPVEILKLRDDETVIALSAVIDNYIYQLRVSTKTANEAVKLLSENQKLDNQNEANVKHSVEVNALERLNSPQITYSLTEVSQNNDNKPDNISLTSMGLIVMFIMFFITEAIGSILKERQMGTWNRILSTPTGNLKIIFGYVLSSLVLGWIQVGVLIAFSKYVFKVNWGSSMPGLFVLFTAFLLAIIGLGTALASFVKSEAQLSAIVPIIIVPTCMIAGCFWPREVMPDAALKISNLVPQTWILKGLTDLISRGADITSIYLPSAILLIFALIFITTGVISLRFEKK